MIVLASYNMKGGVGKTTTAVNLAHTCAASGMRVLLWDLDSQGSATFLYGIDPLDKGGVKRLLKEKKHAHEMTLPTGYPNLDILPAGFDIRHMDIHLEDYKKARKKLGKVLSSLQEHYDYIFLDCPPSISALSEGVFNVADAILMPLIPSILSRETYRQVREYIEGVLDRPVLMLPFFSMADTRKQLHRNQIMECKEEKDFLCTAIPSRSVIERMGLERKPVTAFSNDSRVVGAYQLLWNEIEQRLQGRIHDENRA